MYYFLSCVRFYDDGEDQNDVFVTIEDKSNMSVDFLKRLNAEDRTDDLHRRYFFLFSSCIDLS